MKILPFSHSSVTCDSKSIECVIVRRVGKHPDDNANRPLLITVANGSTKRRIFSRLYRLKDLERYSSLNVSHVMTRDERKQTKALVEKAKKQTEELATNVENKSKNWAYKVRGLISSIINGSQSDYDDIFGCPSPTLGCLIEGGLNSLYILLFL